MMQKIKNINKVIGALIILFALSSCEDLLNESPHDKVTIDRLLNKNTVAGFRDNSYTHLNNNFTKFSSGQLLEAYSDDAFRAGTGVTYDWHNGLLTPDNSMFANAIWSQCWSGIRKCNLAIIYLPQSTVPKDLISDQDLELWYDEVVLLRAYYHFMLIQNFGPVPFVDKPFEPDFVGWNDLKRPTYEEISTRILDECDAIISKGLLPLRWQTSVDFDKVNLAFAYALKSKVSLYNASALNNPNGDAAKWQKAADAASDCLNKLSGEYALLPLEDYANLFNEAVTVVNQEVILRSSNNDAGTMNNNNGVDLSFLGSAKQSGNCGAVPSQELVDCFELLDGTMPVARYNDNSHTSVTLNPGYSEDAGTDPYVRRDARLYHAVVFNGANYGKYKGMSDNEPDLTIFTYDGKAGTGYNSSPTSQDGPDKRRSCTGYYGKKFRSASYWGSTAGGTNSFKIDFRLAEIYLNLAEAECELNRLDQAISALNAIRNRAGQPNVENVSGFVKTKEYIMGKIRNERRVELCFEGHRFYDQRRWKILNETNGALTGMKITSSDNSDEGVFSYERKAIDVTRSATIDKYLVLPIPTEEALRLTGLGQPDAWQ